MPVGLGVVSRVPARSYRQMPFTSTHNARFPNTSLFRIPTTASTPVPIPNLDDGNAIPCPKLLRGVLRPPGTNSVVIHSFAGGFAGTVGNVGAPSVGECQTSAILRVFTHSSSSLLLGEGQALKVVLVEGGSRFAQAMDYRCAISTPNSQVRVLNLEPYSVLTGRRFQPSPDPSLRQSRSRIHFLPRYSRS